MQKVGENTVQNITAEIVAIGTEILLGEITDTNSVFLARGLRDLGINVYFMTSVGDNEKRITDAIRLAMGRAQVVITCGGLGPTVDDMTRQGVANATDRGLTFHQHLLDHIATRFAGFRMQMPENNRRQAYVPDHAIIVENAVGTAPSFIVEHGENIVLSLPGVPREMTYLFTNKIVPYLRERYKLGIIKARVLKTAGVGESALDEQIGDDLLQASNPSIGLAAHSGQVDVRITAKAENETQADALIGLIEAELRERIGEHIFGADSDTLEAALIRVLNASGRKLVLIEAGVPPVVSKRLREADGDNGAVEYYQSYQDVAQLASALSLPSDEPIRALAEAASRQMGVNGNVAIAVISRDTSDADQADQEEVSALAVWDGTEMRSRGYGFGGASSAAKAFAGTWVMAMAWRLLKDSMLTNQVVEDGRSA